MRTFARICLATAIGAAILPAARSAVAASPVQTTEGSVAAPTRFATDPTYTSWPFVQRNVYNVTKDNGHFGFVFPVDAKAVGGEFTIEVTSGVTGSEDIDITWYSSLDPSVSPGGSMERNADGESGTIPSGTKFGLVSLFHGANAEFVFKGYAPAATTEPVLDVPPLPSPGIHPNYGKGDSAYAERLRSRSHVVIALIDTGINPYHLAFRAPEYAVHPSEYVEGFPTDAPAIGLTNGNDYIKNRKTDDAAVWGKVARKKLYWVPGTNIIGAYSVMEVQGTLPEGVEKPRPIIDDHLHGTGVASVSTGRTISPTRKTPFGSNPEALIVVVEGFGTDAMKWVSEQPWIDFVSGSYGDPLAVPHNESIPWPIDAPELPQVGDPDPSREYRHSAPFVLRDGRTACFSAGNGLSRTGVAADRYSSIRPTSGPSWIVTVGAVSPRNGQDYGWHSVPVDVSSYGLHWAAAAPFSVDGEQDFGGTSNATPVTCGVFSKALLTARRALGDAREGIHVTQDGTTVPALGPKGLTVTLGECAPGEICEGGSNSISVEAGGSSIADGVLTREELQEAVFKTAEPGGFDANTFVYDPIAIPDTPAYYTQEGYGIANAASGQRAADVILGKAPMPDRAEVDAWIAQIDSIRNILWPVPTYPKVPPKVTTPGGNSGQKAPTKKPVVKGSHLAATGIADQPWLPLMLLVLAIAFARRLRLAAR